MLLTLLQILLVLFANSPCTLAELSSIIMPLESSTWIPGSQATITYRITGSIGDESYEIDLMTGNPQNAQLVYVFENEAKPTVVGINSVNVTVPSTIAGGTYAVRMGLSSGSSSWKYSQMFTISKSVPPIASDHSTTVPPHNHASENADYSSTASESQSTTPDHLAITNDAVPITPICMAGIAISIIWAVIFT